MAEKDDAASAWTPALALAALSLCGSVALAAAPRDPHRLMAVYPPWISQGEAVNAALDAGDLVGVGGLPFLLLVTSPEPDLSTRLRAGGALMLLDGDVPLFCAQPLERQNAL